MPDPTPIGTSADRMPEPTSPAGAGGPAEAGEEFARLKRRAQKERAGKRGAAHGDAHDFADVAGPERIESTEPVRVDGDQQLLAALERLAAEG